PYENYLMITEYLLKFWAAICANVEDDRGTGRKVKYSRVKRGTKEKRRSHQHRASCIAKATTNIALLYYSTISHIISDPYSKVYISFVLFVLLVSSQALNYVLVE
ncbi:hypothetical protein S245_040707, partial [Arachis hypogaea]